MKTRRVGIVLAILVAAMVLTATPAFAHWPKEGCTPGFWKRHTEMWPDGVYPDTPLSAVDFDLELLTSYGLGEDTFMDALGYPGGKSLEGAARNLMRAAAAAYLNALHPDVDYPWGWQLVVHKTNYYLSLHDRDAMLSFASMLDRWNNLGATFP